MTRAWWENEEIIRGFRDWLTQTEHEIDALDDAGDVAEDERSPGGDNALFFESGSGDPASTTAATGNDRSPAQDVDLRDQPAPDLPEVGLFQLVEAFTAMRHELKLQTKGTRNLESSVAQSLEGLDAASRAFHSAQANEQEAAERASRPMVEALIDLDEGSLRALNAFQATQRQITRSAPAQLRESLDEQFQKQNWWRRITSRRWHARVREAASEALARSTAEEFTSLMQGFELIQARLARTLRQLGIERMDEKGGRVDPSRMSVVELVVDDDVAPETVVDVVRPGYVWGERVVRFAEVRAVASRPIRDDYDPSQWVQNEVESEASEEKTVS